MSRGYLSEYVSPFHDFLNLEATRIGDGEVEVRVPFREDFLRANDSDMIHGGIICALIDIAGDFAVATMLEGTVPTIDLRVDYLRPAMRTDLVAKAKALKVGRTVGVADIEVFDDQGRLIAVGRGAYSTKVG